jgi:hypothetical protein
MSKIRTAWIVPENEVTSYYQVGQFRNRHGNACSKSTAEWAIGCIERHDDQRVRIYDAEGKLRVSLPWAACGVEYE